MDHIEFMFSRFNVPEWVKESLKERSHVTTMKVYVIDGMKYALMTSEVKARYKDAKRERVSIEEWSRIAFDNYRKKRAMFPKLEFELALTVFQCHDPRGNGHIGTFSVALPTWKEEQAIIQIITGGRAIGMMQMPVGINKWMENVFMSYFEEECPAIDPTYDEGMEITLEEMQEYEENLTEDEKLGNL